MPDQPNAFADAMLAIMMLAAFALALGGVYLLVRRGERTKGVLMLVCAAVVLGNVLIWTL